MPEPDDIIQVGPEIPEVVAVETRMPHTLIVTFKDGAIRTVVLKPEELTGVLEPIQDPAYFARAFVDPETRTVAWPNGVDLDPCVLYDPSLRVDDTALEDHRQSKPVDV